MQTLIQKPFQGLLCLLVYGWTTSCVAPGNPKTITEPTPPLQNLVETQPAGKEEVGKKPVELTLTQPELEPQRARARGPRYTLAARDVDVKTILMALSKEIDQNIIIDPGISKTATVDLKDVTLTELLDHLLRPLRLKYDFEKEFIHILPDKMKTRVFHLNYIVSRRIGASNLQSSSGQGTGGGATFSGTIGGSSGLPTGTGFATGAGTGRSTTSVFTSEETDLWNEICFGLRQLVTGVEDNVQATLQSTASSGQGLTGTSQFGTFRDCSSGRGQRPEDKQFKAGEEEEVAYFSINRQAGVIIMKDYPDVLLHVAKFLESIEGSVQRQVFIQAKIIEVTLSDKYKLGIDWSKVSPLKVVYPGDGNLGDSVITGASGFTYGIGNARFDVVVDALSTQGDVSVLSSPKIATLNNQRAVIKVGTEDIFFIPEVTPATTTTASTTEFIPSSITIGIVLDVLPQINANGMVMMSINTSITEKIGERISPDGVNVVPVVDVRESNNVVLANHGQTIVIGGLMKTKKETNENSLPVLGSIPILGRLFQREEEVDEKTELVIMLTPEVMVGQAIDDRLRKEESRLDRLGFTYPVDDDPAWEYAN